MIENPEISIIETWQHPDRVRGSLVVTSQQVEIVITYDDQTTLRRHTTLSRAEAMQIAEHVRDQLTTAQANSVVDRAA